MSRPLGHKVSCARVYWSVDAVTSDMSAILFIKTSSFGDVIHMMPALSDARRALPNAHLAWVVDESYAPLVRLHPAVDEVLPISWRRWRRRLHSPSAWREMLAFSRGLRSRRYDAVVDTQGLIHSACIARLAIGRRHGYDVASIRESLATSLYDVQHAISPNLSAIERNRRLTGAAVGYSPSGAINYGLFRPGQADRRGPAYALLVHATARAEKNWPEASWIEIGQRLSRLGFEIVLPSGSAAEHTQAVRIAAGVRSATAPDSMSLDRVVRLVAGASLVVGVDTGLLHLGVALGVPTVAIFAASNPALTGPRGHVAIEIVASRPGPATADEVIAAVDRVLDRAPSRVSAGRR